MDRNIFLILIHSLILFSLKVFPQQYELSGSIIDSVSNQQLQYCNVLILDTPFGSSTDENGKYTLMLQKGSYRLQITYIGYEDYKTDIKINSNTILNVKLQPAAIHQKDLTVIGAKNNDSNLQTIQSKEIKLMPNVFSDPLRSVQVMSGVVTNNELSTGYNVRGGNYDENLIYLNGYEIYRPFLLRQAGEDLFSLVNPDMVSRMSFYNGAFTARYGDKMSSALEVDYSTNTSESIHANFRADLLNIGVNLQGSRKKFNWNLGARYSYPGSFIRSLQTLGDYNPKYSDIQLLSKYSINEKSSLEFFGLYAVNSFYLKPENWIGNFGGLTRGDNREVEITYDGERNYNFTTFLAGLKYNATLLDDFIYNLNVSNYNTREKENENLRSDLYYKGQEGEDLLDYLKSKTEDINNSLDYNSIAIKSTLAYNYNNYSVLLGAEYQFNNLTNKIDEYIVESGDSSLLIAPRDVYALKNDKLNSFSSFVEANFNFFESLIANVGIRFTRYNYSDENLFSPRINLIWKPNILNKFSFSWGCYYQPPFINELRNPELTNLKSQNAIHYIAGWENQFKEKIKLNVQVYYKDLDNLIPFYFEKMKMLYVEGNTRDGYTFGADLQFDGEIVEGMRSLVSYGYLDSKERNKNGGSYQRRLTDQTHTVQIFFQDKFKKHPNWQSHVKFLFGSGMLYYQRVITEDPAAGLKMITVDINNPQEYFLFFRVDMGLSASFEISEKSKLLVVAEVLNVFNHRNYLGYDWVKALKEYNYLFRIPHILSPRFFNIRVELAI